MSASRRARVMQASLECPGFLIVPAAAAGHTLPAAHGMPLVLLDKDMMSRGRKSPVRTCASTAALSSVPYPTMSPYLCAALPSRCRRAGLCRSGASVNARPHQH